MPVLRAGLGRKRNPQHPRRERRPRCCAVGRCCDNDVSDGTIAYLRAILSSALSHAMREDDLPRNVASVVRLGGAGRSCSSPHRRRGPQAPGSGHAPPVAGAVRARATHRLRRGELLGLKWTDIDLDGGTRTLQRTAAGLQLFPTKTVGSQRRILLPRITVTSLRQHRRRQQAEARGNPPGSNPHGLVFVTTAGQPVDAGALNKNLVTLCKMAGIHRNPGFMISAPRAGRSSLSRALNR
jgi:integrase